MGSQGKFVVATTDLLAELDGHPLDEDLWPIGFIDGFSFGSICWSEHRG